MSSVQYVNSKAEVIKKVYALAMNIQAATGLMDIMKSNLGPKGTLKMIVGGAGQIKLTKDGNVLLHEMQIQHPTAAMIARCATAQDDIVGDGTTSNVLFIGELMKQAQRLYQDGIHPRMITDGYELAKVATLKFLETFKSAQIIDKQVLLAVARTSLGTKLHPEMAEHLVGIIVDAVQIIQKDSNIDLFMIEIMHMVHKLATETRLVKGLVLDHGARHSKMPKVLKNCYILTCNVSLEYEKTEVHSQFFYSDAQTREKLQQSERKFTDERCQKIIELKNKVCTPENQRTFMIVNQKGIDPICLDALAKENIIALRRAKRRNMERIVLACGGNAVNSVDELTEKDLGFAEDVYEQTLGEEKYTFIEGVKNPKSCTILIKGPNEHTIAMIKDAIRDGLRAVKNTIDDKCVIPGAGAFEVAAYCHLQQFKDSVAGKQKLGVNAFADSLLVIPKTLAENSGYDAQDVILEMIDEYKKQKVPVGINCTKQEIISPEKLAIYDNYLAKKQFLHIAPSLVEQLLLVDEIMRAGKGMGSSDKTEQ